MIKRFVVVLLLVIIGQATYTVHGAMNFPVFGYVQNGTFHGTAVAYGTGSFNGSATVILTLAQIPIPNPKNLEAVPALTATCVNPAGHVAPGQNKIALSIPPVIQSAPCPTNKNGNCTINFSFSIPIPLPSSLAAGCPNANWKVSGLNGQFYATYYGTEVTNTQTFNATAGLLCTLNWPSGTCTQVFNVHN